MTQTEYEQLIYRIKDKTQLREKEIFDYAECFHDMESFSAYQIITNLLWSAGWREHRKFDELTCQCYDKFWKRGDHESQMIPLIVQTGIHDEELLRSII